MLRDRSQARVLSYSIFICLSWSVFAHYCDDIEKTDIFFFFFIAQRIPYTLHDWCRNID